eukprot:3879603-Prymnesium_polylepis.1
MPFGLALRAEPLWLSTMGFILAGGVVPVYVEMVGGASLKRTTRERGAGAVISGGCECGVRGLISGISETTVGGILDIAMFKRRVDGCRGRGG